MRIDKKALKFAYIKHQNQKRKNGEDYIVHPIAVAKNVKMYKKSHNINNLLAAAYLHDTLEDTNTNYYELISYFGFNIASLVLELTNDEDIKQELGKTKYLCYKLKNMTSWALTIKLCDRLDNVKDLINADIDFKNRYKKETNDIIKYIINNRKLSNTQLRIIQEINNYII